MSLLEGLANPDSPQLADQGVLPCQPALIIFHYNADNLGKRDEEDKMVRSFKIILNYVVLSLGLNTTGI